MTRLFILSGPNDGQSFELEGDAFYIGRSPYSDVQIEDTFVSCKHLNGEQISPGIETELKEGLPVFIGMSVICLGQGCTEELSVFPDAINLSD